MITYSDFDRDGQPLGGTRRGDEARAALRQIGVETGHFERPAVPVSSMPMLTHARVLLALQHRFDTVLTDRVQQRAWQGGKPFPPSTDSRLSWPDPGQEHRHDDLELRLVLGGRLRVLLRVPTGHAAAIVEAGTWLALPAGLAHLAQACAGTGVDLLRLFSKPNGWVAQATRAALPQRLLQWPVIHPPLALAA